MSHLLPREIVLASTQRHFLFLLLPLVFLLIGAAFFLTQSCPLAVALRLDGRCYPVVGAAFLFAGGILVLDGWGTRFVLTSQRLMKTQTPVWLRSEILQLDSIESLTLKIGLLGRLFGFGTIFADSTATRRGRIALDFIPDPQRFHHRISGAIAQQRAQS